MSYSLNLNIDWGKVITIISALAAVFSAIYAYKSNKNSKEANQLAKEGNVISREANERTIKLQFENDYNDFIRIIPKYRDSLNKLVQKHGNNEQYDGLIVRRGTGDISGDIHGLIEEIEEAEKFIKIPLNFKYILLETLKSLKNIKFQYNINRGNYNPTEDLNKLIEFLNTEIQKIEEHLSIKSI